MIKQHDQGKLHKKEFRVCYDSGGLRVRHGGEACWQTAGMAAAAAGRGGLTSHLCAESRKSEEEMW